MDRKDNFQEGKEIVLATTSKDCKPNANIVISLWFHEDKLLVADCLMNITIKNLIENPDICIIGGYIRIKWKAEIHWSGECFDICRNKSKWYFAKNAILITIKEVFDLDKNEFVKKNI